MHSRMPSWAPVLMQAKMDCFAAAARTQEGGAPQVVTFAADVEHFGLKAGGKLVKKDRVEYRTRFRCTQEGEDPALQAAKDPHRLKAGMSSSGRTSALPTWRLKAPG
jgi:hypothetical protein